MRKKCLYCKAEFEDHTKKKYCTDECKLIGKSILKYPDGSDYVKCQICGCRASDLHKHITRYHKMTIEDYCKRFNIEEIELQSLTLRNHNSEMQKKAYAEGRLQGWGKGDANPSRRKEVKEGRKSIFSKNCEKYDGMSDEEKEIAIDNILKDLAKKKKEKNNNPLTIAYYLKRGATEEEAKKLLNERQRTFSLEICIEKFGKEEGEKRFKDRQKKWQNTLNQLPQEEIIRINKAKASSSKFVCAYSKISQKLFNDIFEKIKDSYSDIFYATHGNQENLNANFEYEVLLEDGIHRFFLDFYVKDVNKVIEFDGDYWHGEKRGNQQRDKEREQKLKQLGFTNIFHVKESDYRNDPKKILNDCIEFIKS